MNFRKKLIFPKKDCISFLFTGNEIRVIALKFLGSTFIPIFTMIYPKRVPFDTPKMIFLGLREIPYLRHCSNICLR